MAIGNWNQTRMTNYQLPIRQSSTPRKGQFSIPSKSQGGGRMEKIKIPMRGFAAPRAHSVFRPSGCLGMADGRKNWKCESGANEEYKKSAQCSGLGIGVNIPPLLMPWLVLFSPFRD